MTRPSASKHGRQPPASELIVTRSARGWRACREVAFERLGGGISVLAFRDGKCGDVDGAALPRQLDRFVEQRATAIDVCRIEHAGRELARAQCFADQCQTARTVAEMQMQDARLARHHAGDVAFGCDPQQLIEGRLARSMVADRNLADADQRFDEHQIATHAAGERRRWHVIATGVAVSVESFFAQRVERREQFARSARDVVGP